MISILLIIVPLYSHIWAMTWNMICESSSFQYNYISFLLFDFVLSRPKHFIMSIKMIILYFRNNSKSQIPRRSALQTTRPMWFTNNTFRHEHDVKGYGWKLVWFYAVPTRVLFFTDTHFLYRRRNQPPPPRSRRTVDELYKTFRYGQTTSYCIVYWNLKILWIASNAKRTEIEWCLREGLYTKEPMTTVDNEQYYFGPYLSPNVWNSGRRTFWKELKIIYHHGSHWWQQQIYQTYYTLL